MWASKATYLTQLGQVYAKITDQAVEAIIVRFFGFFFLGNATKLNKCSWKLEITIFFLPAWQSAELWGNLISSLVLSSGAHGSGGGSANYSDAALDLCGANFCVKETSDNANLERPPDSEIYLISSIYLACIFCAVVIIALFMDPLSRYGDRRRGSISAVELSGTQLLTATFKQLRKPNQQLLIPLTIFIGMLNRGCSWLMNFPYTKYRFVYVKRNGTGFYRCWFYTGLWIDDKLRKVQSLNSTLPGLCFLCIGNPSNWLRNDLLWRR